MWSAPSELFEKRHKAWVKLAKEWGLTLEYDEESHETKIYGDLGGLSVQILDKRGLRHKNAPLDTEFKALGSWPDSIFVRTSHYSKKRGGGGVLAPENGASRDIYWGGPNEDLLLLLTPKVRRLFERYTFFNGFLVRNSEMSSIRKGILLSTENFNTLGVDYYAIALEIAVALEEAWQNPLETLIESIHSSDFHEYREVCLSLLFQRFPEAEETQALAKSLLKSSDFSEQILAARKLSDLEHLLGLVEGKRHREDLDKKKEDWVFPSFDEEPEPRAPRHPLDAHQIEALSACRFGDEKGLIAGHLEGLLSKKIFLGAELQLAFIEALRENPPP